MILSEEEKIRIDFQKALYLHQDGKLDEAQLIYSEILKVNPKHANSWHFLGVVALMEFKELDSAFDIYSKAIELNSNNPDFHYNLGNVLKELGKLDLAVLSYNKEIEINPNFVEAYYNLENLLSETKQVEVALFNYQKAFQLSPSCKFLLGSILNAKSKICDWSSYAQEISDLENRLLKKELVVSPFAILSIIDSASLHCLVANMNVQTDYPSIDIF
jgi:tetratricopeptide (TPR) repeat protein